MQITCAVVRYEKCGICKRGIFFFFFFRLLKLVIITPHTGQKKPFEKKTNIGAETEKQDKQDKNNEMK